MSSPPPEGIDARHIDVHRYDRLASAVMLVLLGVIIAFGLSGMAGGRMATTAVRAPAAELSVTLPPVIRNGEFFELRFAGTVHRDVDDLTISLPADFWRDLTINTGLPSPGRESYADGRFAFHFGPHRAGDDFLFKVDGQVNPIRFGNSAANVEVRDGASLLASQHLHLTVMP